METEAEAAPDLVAAMPDAALPVASEAVAAEPEPAVKPKLPSRSRKPSAKKLAELEAAAAADASPVAVDPIPTPVAEPVAEMAEALVDAPEPEASSDAEALPKKRGWWSIGR